MEVALVDSGWAGRCLRYRLVALDHCLAQITISRQDKVGLYRKNPHTNCPPAAIGFGVWFLDKNTKERDAQREENENKNQALQIYFEYISAILLDKQVISLAESAKK
jgi:hypothetical protein